MEESKTRLLIFGTGIYYKNRKMEFEKDEIVAFVDNAEEKWGKTLDGRLIISPDEIKDKTYDYICIMVRKESEINIRKQLKLLNVPDEKIKNFFEYTRLLKNEAKLMIHYGENVYPSNGKKIILMTHELSYTGAPLVLFYMARILHRNGYYVFVLSLKDGALREDYIKEGIAVGIQEDGKELDLFLLNMLRGADLTWGNTVAYQYLVSKFNQDGTKFVWWIHECGEIKELSENYFPNIVNKNINVYAVGHLAMESVKKYFPSGNVRELLYGLPDIAYGKKILKVNREKIVLCIIGTICPRKGQDILLDAIELLELDERKKIEVWVVGEILNKEYYNLIKHRLDCIFEVKELGALDRKEIEKLYESIDVLICPSRWDPMPVVTVEAMMFEKPCIVSNATGIAKFIEDKQNGFVFEADNSLELSDKIRWVLNNREHLLNIGKRARLIYDRNFSVSVFEKKVLNIVDDVINGRSEECLEDKEVILYGKSWKSADICDRLKEKKEKVLYVVDNNAANWGEYYHGVRIFPPDRINVNGHTLICITAESEEEAELIKKKLKNVYNYDMGVVMSFNEFVLQYCEN